MRNRHRIFIILIFLRQLEMRLVHMRNRRARIFLLDSKLRQPARLFNNSFNLLNYHDSAKTFFRFSVEQILQLVDLLNFPVTVRLNNGILMPGLECFCILLRRMAYPCRFVDLEEFFEREASEISRAFNYMIDIMYDVAVARLNLTSINVTRYNTLLRHANEFVPFENTIFFIDGTVRRICRATNNQKVTYNGHKRKHALKYQSIVSLDGLIADLRGPYCGSRHDARMLSDSKVMHDIYNLNNSNNIYINCYGDPAYPNIANLHRPFIGGNITAE